jgi:hypothetical protein
MQVLRSSQHILNVLNGKEHELGAGNTRATVKSSHVSTNKNDKLVGVGETDSKPWVRPHFSGPILRSIYESPYAFS